MDKAIKAAKKLLKKNDDGSMKMKELAKAVLGKIDDNGEGLKSSQVKEWILGCDKFSVDGKVVSLKSSSKKRKDMDGGSSGDAEDEKAKKKAAKRAKKESMKKKNESGEANSSATCLPPSSEITLDEATKWRSKNKVVLKVTQDNGDNGVAASKELNSNEVYLPYHSFSSPRCIENIDSTLLAQCTKVNGFKSPSAIQAQCWPVLLHSDNGKKRDIVG